MSAVPEIRIGREDDELVLRNGGAWGFRTLLAVPGLRAETNVYLTDPDLERPLSDFFDNLALHWRGWDEKREWETYGGQLKLAADHDGSGHIEISVQLREYSGLGWCATAIVLVDAGQLERLADDVRHFLSRE